MITKVKTANHDEWLALRKKYIGGSDAATVVGMNTFSSPYALWAEKTGRIPGFSGNLSTEVGAYLEDFVAKKFEQETGKKVRRVNQSFLNDQYPWSIGNIDREIVGEDAGLEIKTTSELNLKKFKGGEYPENYYCQCVHYLAVTGKQRWYLAVLIGNREFQWFNIERDEEEIAALMQAEQEFWEYVKSNTPPPADGAKATTETIVTLYPESDDSDVDLYCYESDLMQYLELTARIKELEKQRDEHSNRVKSFMAEAGKGGTDSYSVSWKTAQRNTFDYKRFAADHDGIDLSKYFNTSTYRTFKVNKRKGA